MKLALNFLSAACVFSACANSRRSFSTDHFTGSLDESSGVLRSLKPSSGAFDFSPSDVFDQRNGNGNYHTGDLTLRYRTNNNATWTEGNTAAQRTTISHQESDDTILSSQLDGAIGGISNDLSITRSWFEYDGDLALNFTLKNVKSDGIEVGSLGFPIEFNNIFTGRSAVATREKCVLVDPFIGLDAGYVQVTRLLGVGPHLLVSPLGADTKIEAWRFLHEATDTSLAYQSQVFEGNYEWQVYSKAYAEQEWQNATPWNEPTSLQLKPGQSVSFGLRFTVVPSVEKIEDTVLDVGRPVAVGIPGYVLPRDMKGRVFLNGPSEISSITVSPKGSLSVGRSGKYGNAWTGLDVAADNNAFGRSTVEVTYADGIQHNLHYFITDTGPASLAKLGKFLTEKQWLSNMSDPFGRVPSIITYDQSVDGPVLQDNRAWIAGISDDGGAGSFEAAAIKQSVYPVASEVAQLEEFVGQTAWARLQLPDGPNKYGVRKSLFFYEPEAVPEFQYDPGINWNGVWNQTEASLLTRAYNYVHVSCLYWSLYRAGRISPDVLSERSSMWYLLQSYNTVKFAFGTHADGSNNTDFHSLGLMGETIWKSLIKDLDAENHESEAKDLESIMQQRAQVWSVQQDPFGSEQAWDSTGQEGVYLWSKRFGFTDTVNKTLNSIRGYMPTVAHWGWNGNARRYWDFTTAGKISRIERQIHHYGSGLNALPMLESFRSSSDPTSLDSIYDLRIGYGGHQGSLTNIGTDGFASMSMHSFPETLEWDPYSGDYGLNFVGQVLGAATYLVNHPIFGWVSFGGNIVSSDNDVLVVEPKDTVRHRIYVANLGLYVTVDAGAITRFALSIPGQRLTVELADVAEGSGAEAAKKATVEYASTNTAAISLVGNDVTETQRGHVVVFKSGQASLAFTWGD